MGRNSGPVGAKMWLLWWLLSICVWMVGGTAVLTIQTRLQDHKSNLMSSWITKLTHTTLQKVTDTCLFPRLMANEKQLGVKLTQWCDEQRWEIPGDVIIQRRWDEQELVAVAASCFLNSVKNVLLSLSFSININSSTLSPSPVLLLFFLVCLNPLFNLFSLFCLSSSFQPTSLSLRGRWARW